MERAGNSWWVRGRQDLLIRVLERFPPPAGPACDFGCGAGAVLEVLAHRPEIVSALGIDISEEAVALCRKKELAALQGDERSLAVHGPFALVTAFDVLEHVEDDARALAAISKALVPGGLVVVVAPAYPRFYSYHDRALGHFRRYTGGSLKRLLEECELEVKLLSHFNLLGLPAAALVRAAGTALGRQSSDTALLARTPGWVDRALISWCRLESRAATGSGLPAGLSLVAVGKKPAT
jgi:SAM-dependent methyltransferase